MFMSVVDVVSDTRTSKVGAAILVPPSTALKKLTSEGVEEITLAECVCEPKAEPT